jgi:hypothetical protein
MGRFFINATDGTKYRIDLLSLSAYEADGGRYDDTGNGGEACEKSEFLAAFVAAEKDGDDWNEGAELAALAAAGIPDGTIWHDSVTGWYLLRDWPAEAPLSARMLND